MVNTEEEVGGNIDIILMVYFDSIIRHWFVGITSENKKKTVLSASYVKRQGAISTNQWTFAQTSPWIAVGNVIIVLAHIPYVSTIYRRSICTVLGE